MKVLYREDLGKIQLIDDIKSQLSNAKTFSVLIILSSALNIFNNQGNILFYMSLALIICAIGYAYYMLTKKSYKEFYTSKEIKSFKTTKILNVKKYKLQLANGKHRDLNLYKLNKTVKEFVNFCKEHNIKIED
ncbi:hypothetical protein M4I21_07765 [Cellulophaga sp. 20_2_10]|uniref:hypothetical protein n=1 Tax=Cellulophaga sp. 20_2_10 TaxID=2942476 RepID=UPI00201AB27F|nr:hypothetical protein [Cellulophaga sp. 20_2_10]MCL5245699.1 hypothetical protein [Cellulophaga sp. 20_2_10]